MTEIAISQALDVLIQDENGQFTYSNEKALFGYLDINYRMPLFEGRIYNEPANFKVDDLGKADAISSFMDAAGQAIRSNNPYLPDLPDAGTKPTRSDITAAGTSADEMTNEKDRLRIEFMKLAMLNYRYLKLNNTNMPDNDAMLISFLRARWIILGALYNTREARNVTYDEIVYIKPTDDKYADIDSFNTVKKMMKSTNALDLAFFSFLNANKDFTIFVTKYAETIWCISEFVFRVRGHHYKTEHTKLIEKAFSSVAEDNIAWPSAFNMEHAFRTAIHPFGIKALPIMAYKWLAWGKMGNGLILRLSGAPNGFAAITTAAAGVKILATESWYNDLRSKYREQLDTIEGFAKIILDNKYNYHLSASLYGAAVTRTLTYNGKTYTMAEADQIVGSVAPIIQGFISWARDRTAGQANATFSFGNAKVLEKRAASNPLMSERMKEILEYTIKAIGDSRTTREAIKQAFSIEESE